MGYKAFKTRLFAGLSLGMVAGTFAPYAFAQTAPGPVPRPLEVSGQRSENASETTSVDEVVVTGSRVIRNGTQAPTPTTVATSENLEALARPNVADYLIVLPQVRGSVVPSSNGVSGQTSGRNFISLRNLGPNRGLILLNGRRIVPTGSTGNVDLNLLPQALLQRVDVVTGGASAAYGSDAVAGVVNFILDDKFEGVKGELQYGISGHDDNRSVKASLAAGGTFADGRGRILASAEFSDLDGVEQDGTRPDAARPYNNNARVRIANPAVNATNPASASNPRFILIDNARLAIANFNGVVQSGPLAQRQFGPDGSLLPYNQGSPRSGQIASGGEGYNFIVTSPLSNPNTRANLYTRVSYDVSEATTVFAEVWAGGTNSQTRSLPSYTITSYPAGFPVRIDNAYLSPSTVAAMTAARVTSLPVNLIFSGGGTIPEREIFTRGLITQATFGAEGRFGSDYRWSTYVQYGRDEDYIGQLGNTNRLNFDQAVDAVRDPATGRIVCRSTLTNRTNGCVPINFFGNNPITAEQSQYVFGKSEQRVVSEIAVAEVNLEGELFSLPAGRVAIAVGANAREEKISQTVDPISTAPNPATGLPTGGWFFTNPKPLEGSFNLYEVFGEVLVPVLKDLPFASSLDLNAAVRRTEYSISGGVTTYKLGLSYAPFEDLRFRATRSRDIRAPNISEFFRTSFQAIASITDPVNNNITYSVVNRSEGNPNLQPESADTTTFGVVYRPSRFPGAYATVDFYDIVIDGAIGELPAQTTINECRAGNQTICALIERDPVSNLVTALRQPLLNLSSVATSGVDFEAGYRQELEVINGNLSGRVDLRATANYIDSFVSTTPGSAPIEAAGGLGVARGGQALPKWTGNLNVTYTDGPLSVFGQTRWIGAAKFDNTLTEIDLANNSQEDVFYHDLGVRYRFNVGGSDVEMFGNVENVFDTEPPFVPTVFTGNYTSLSLYDAIGRTFRVGLRFRL